MTASAEYRGRCRLMLRMPAWRVELKRVTDPAFLDVCEAYELVWDAIVVFSRANAKEKVEEFRELANFLEGEALLISLKKLRAGSQYGPHTLIETPKRDKLAN